jgi:antitoxin component of MazEF toxin-antitoxin module
METIAKLKKWGNSLGIVIPIEAIKSKNLNEGDEVVVTVQKKNSIRSAFGSVKGWKIDSQKVKDDLRKEWSKW